MKTSRTGQLTGPALWLLAIFVINFLSLVYQVVWVRKTMVIFGTTALSISTVLTVFLGGIALGGYLGGVWIRRIERKYRFAGCALLALGLYCLFSNYLFGFVRYPFLYLSGVVEDPLTINLLKFLFCFFILIFPTTVIGLMFPVATYLYSIEFKRLGRDVASIYFLDTLGAALGALVCGFFLVPWVGLNLTSAGGAFIYMLLGLFVYRMEAGGTGTVGGKGVESFRKDGEGLKNVHILILVAVCFSGFAALLLEVTWARYFHLIFGTSIYAFSLVAAAFLLGLSAGSFLIRRFLDGIKNPMLVFAYVEIIIAGFCLVVLQTSGALESFYFDYFKKTDNFYLFQGTLFLAAFFMMFVPTFLMGANFPLAVRLFARSGATRGKDSGLIFSVNTAGGIVGAFAAGFLVIPRLGLEHTNILAAVVYLGIGFVLLVYSARRLIVHAAVTASLTIVFFLFGLFYYGEPRFGFSVYYTGIGHETFDEFLKTRKQRELLYSKQGFYGLVTVHVDRVFNIFSIQNNGKTDASTGSSDMKLQLMLGHVPLFLHTKPRDVLNIGLGGGFTLGAITTHPDIETIDCVEIDPLVVEAVDLYFSPHNNNALADPRLRVHIEDGRHFLDTTAKKYDVVVSEPPNIWVSGVSQLFTREFYRIVDEHLNEEGILAQWVPGYEMEQEDLELILNTIRQRFTRVGFWVFGNGDVLILASHTHFLLNKEYVSKLIAVPAIANDLNRVLDSVDPDSFFHFLSSPAAVMDASDEYVDKIQRVNTDNLPYLEFKTVRNIFNKAHGRRPLPSLEAPPIL
jgi:spermidine synthase